MYRSKIINILETQINQEITRLEQVKPLDLAREQTKLSVYHQLVQII